MMKLHTLKNEVKRQARRRVGRGDGSGHGRTCGRGDKGAGARSGNTRRPHFEGGQITLFRRLPKRGFKNPNHCTYDVINVAYLEECFESGAVVTADELRKRGILGKTTAGLKILGDGELSKSLTVKAVKFSASAVAKIEAAGGVCEVI
jgi:large subunit ribosomal protein L15